MVGAVGLFFHFHIFSKTMNESTEIILLLSNVQMCIKTCTRMSQIATGQLVKAELIFIKPEKKVGY